MSRNVDIGPAPKEPISPREATKRLRALHEEYDSASDPRRAEIREEIRNIQKSVAASANVQWKKRSNEN